MVETECGKTENPCVDLWIHAPYRHAWIEMREKMASSTLVPFVNHVMKVGSTLSKVTFLLTTVILLNHVRKKEIV